MGRGFESFKRLSNEEDNTRIRLNVTYRLLPLTPVSIEGYNIRLALSGVVLPALVVGDEQ